MGEGRIQKINYKYVLIQDHYYLIFTTF